MTRTILRAGLLALAVVALCGVAAEAQDLPPVNFIETADRPGGGVRDFARRLPSLDGIPAVPLPKPGEPDTGMTAVQGPVGPALPGPIGSVASLAQAAAPAGAGMSLLAPGGSASFMTPQRIGERQIRKLVRALD